jgi:hypothetical protein
VGLWVEAGGGGRPSPPGARAPPSGFVGGAHGINYPAFPAPQLRRFGSRRAEGGVW